MKKSKILIVTLICFIVFFISINNVKALDVCDIKNNYGEIDVRWKDEVTLGDTNYAMSRISYWCYNGSLSVGAAAKSTCDNPSEKFYIQYNIAKTTSNSGGYVKSAKFTIYDKSDKAQCYIEYNVDSAYGKYGVFQFEFNLNKKEVGKIVASGTYYTGEKTKSFDEDSFDINKDGDGSGADHTTNKGDTTTKLEGEAIDGGGAASGTAKGSAKPMLQTDKNGNVINSYDKKQACTSVRDIVRDYWKYVLVIAPVLLIVVITLDFFKALSSNDADAIKKAGTNTVKRTIAAVILLALPALLGIVFDLFGLDLCV